MTDEKCSVQGCDNPVKSHGLCQKHYMAERRAARVGSKVGIPGAKECKVSGCDRYAESRGMCQAHYYRLMNNIPVHGLIQVRMEAAGHKCSENGCDNEVYAKSLCQKHYVQARRQSE